MKTVMKLLVPKKCGDFLVAESVFQEEICCVELVSYAYASI